MNKPQLVTMYGDREVSPEAMVLSLKTGFEPGIVQTAIGLYMGQETYDTYNVAAKEQETGTVVTAEKDGFSWEGFTKILEALRDSAGIVSGGVMDVVERVKGTPGTTTAPGGTVVNGGGTVAKEIQWGKFVVPAITIAGTFLILSMKRRR